MLLGSVTGAKQGVEHLHVPTRSISGHFMSSLECALHAPPVTGATVASDEDPMH